MPQKHFMVALKLTKRRKKNSKPHFRQEKNYGMKKSKNSTQISKKKKYQNSSNYTDLRMNFFFICKSYESLA